MTLMMGALQGLEGWAKDYNLEVGTRYGSGTGNFSGTDHNFVETNMFIYNPQTQWPWQSYLSNLNSHTLNFVKIYGQILSDIERTNPQNSRISCPEILTSRGEEGWQTLEDVVSVTRKNHHALVKVMMLHSGGGVEDRERGINLKWPQRCYLDFLKPNSLRSISDAKHVKLKVGAYI